MKKLPLFLSILALAAVVTTPAGAQSCDAVQFGVALGDQTEADQAEFSWVPSSGALVVPAGAQGVILVRVSSGNDLLKPVAEIGYPHLLGIPGPSGEEVRKVIRMGQQPPADRQAGRLRFTEVMPGSTQLAYRIERVPADDALGDRCRTGLIALEVAAEPLTALQGERRAANHCQQVVRQELRGEIREFAQSRPAAGVTLFRGANYSGVRETFLQDDPKLSGNTIGNDTVSSVKVSPGCSVTLYAGGNYSGNSITIDRDTPQVRREGIGNDKVSSLRVQCEEPRKTAKVEWEGEPEIYRINEELIGVRGTMSVRSDDPWTPMTYTCTVERESLTVTEVSSRRP